MNIKYIQVGDYLLPNLIIKKETFQQIGKYGYLRLNYIKKYKKALYQSLLMKNELMDNYIKTDERLSEKNKEINQIGWVKLMNNYKNIVEEIILKELIYV